MIAEFGSSHPVRFMEKSSVRMIDEDGNESEIPTCNKCHNAKCMIVGSGFYDWICSNCIGDV